MGKSSKKVEAAAPVAVVPTKPLKKGKREAEESIEKAVVKKQKKIVVEEPIKKKVPEVKKKIDESSSEDDSSSDEEVKAPAAKAAPPAKNGTVKKGKQSSSSSSSEESDDSEDEVPKSKAATKNVPAATKADSSSEDDSSSDDDDVPAPAAKSGKSDIKKKESSSDESSDSDSDTLANTIPKKPSATVNKKVEESSDDSSEEDSEDEKPQKKTKLEPAAAVKAKPDSDSEDESSDESSEEEDAKAPVVKKAAVAKSSSDESSEDESSDEEEEPSKTPLKKSADVEMVDAYPSTKKEPKTPSTQASGSKTLFVGNLPFTVERSDVEGFFQECGEVVDVRFATHPDGAFKGFGHVEFATSEAAEKALKDLNGGDLMGRELRLDRANERGAFTPQSGRDGASFQKFTAYVRGLDNSADENDIKTALREHFQGCGEITRISVPTGDDGVKGFAYLDFTSKDALNKAFELNNTTVGDYPVTVEEARPREPRDNSGPPSRFNSNSRSHGRFNNSRGRSDNNGGRFSNRGRGRSDRGRGGFSKPNLATPGTGKKTTFDD